MPNPFLDLLEENPRFAFFSHLNEQGFNRPKRRSIADMFGEVQAEFQGQLGSQIRQGQEPTLRWNNFLENYDWDQLYFSQPPSQRGNQGFGRFSPRVRHLLRF